MVEVDGRNRWWRQMAEMDGGDRERWMMEMDGGDRWWGWMVEMDGDGWWR